MATSEPLISAMMLVRDRADLIEAAAMSVLTQTERDLELIILDDGSRDDTWRICQQLAERDERVVLLQNATSCGIPTARNQVLAAARGRYVAIADSDDLSRPERFARQRALLDEDPALTAVSCRFHTFTGPDPAATGTEPSWHFDLRAGRLPGLFPGMMLRTQAVREVGGFDPRYAIAEDLHLAYRLAGRGARFQIVDAVLLDYRIHEGSITQRRAAAREWWNLRAQLVGLRELRGRFNARGYAVLVQSVLRLALAAVGLRR